MTSIRDLITKHGIGAKFVRAFCRDRQWRYDKNGAPDEWYAAWRDGLGLEVETLLQETK